MHDFQSKAVEVVQKNIIPSTKKKVQLTFNNVHISALPKKKKCGGKGQAPQQPKVILNDVSGTIQPGQFLAIIGASGKSFLRHLITWYRRWQDHLTQLPLW